MKYPPLETFTHKEHGLDADAALPELLGKLISEDCPMSSENFVIEDMIFGLNLHPAERLQALLWLHRV